MQSRVEHLLDRRRVASRSLEVATEVDLQFLRQQVGRGHELREFRNANFYGRALLRLHLLDRRAHDLSNFLIVWRGAEELGENSDACALERTPLQRRGVGSRDSAA